MTRILLVSGSTYDGSLQTAALRTAANFAPAGIDATLYDGLRRLPAFVPGERYAPDTVNWLRHRVRASDAVLFCTPEYAGTLPGSLKNLLDWLIDGEDLKGKPVAWLSTATEGRDEGARATLETVLTYAKAKILSSACIRIPLDPGSVDRHGYVTDQRLHVALLDVVQALLRSLVPVQEKEPQRQEPAWEAYSSVYPIVMRRGGGGS
ncbi:NAD(P)H-dependent oxidoreductase [Actinoplanes sp. NPDC051633]|uniref:NADPH-dependent FMN reductase n=1 Tax=Actinoplanes sp. NPDC051633 TaxID=3155670 RepID=UPI00341AD64C